MKKLFLFAALILEFGIINSQAYAPFPDSNAFWNEFQYHQGQCDPPDYCKYTYYLQGDTILNSQLYHKIYSNDSYSISYVGGIQEIDKIVSFFDRDCSAPVLLYDFGLNVGDSIPLSCMLCDEEEPLYMKVNSIDSVLIGDMSYRKRINFDYGPSQSWIEGIGSVSGLLYPYYSCFTCICGLELVCFEQNNIVLYQNENNVSCFNYAVPSSNLDITSEWRVDYQQSWYPGEFWNNVYRDYIDGDTVINSYQYYKIYQSGYSFEGIVPVGEVYSYDHVLHGFLREENGKWYTYYENTDALLFDFTLDVNDTVYSAYSFLTPDYQIIVMGIDSILVDGEYKRRLQLNNPGAEYIIEGIGATSGLFENMFFFEWYSQLVCYAKNGVSVWGESTEECDLAVTINDDRGNTDPCSVFPNPAKDFTMLTIPSGLNNVTIRLFDLVGGIVCQKSFESPSTNKILLTAYHSGVYLAIIESKGFRQTIKLIKE